MYSQRRLQHTTRSPPKAAAASCCRWLCVQHPGLHCLQLLLQVLLLDVPGNIGQQHARLQTANGPSRPRELTPPSTCKYASRSMLRCAQVSAHASVSAVTRLCILALPNSNRPATAAQARVATAAPVGPAACCNAADCCCVMHCSARIAAARTCGDVTATSSNCIPPAASGGLPAAMRPRGPLLGDGVDQDLHSSSKCQTARTKHTLSG